MMDLDLGNAFLTVPAVLPIFPLDGALLLPHGHLPLHIFEPRYVNMVEAALGRQRLIGMVQPRRKSDPADADTVAIYETGCAGKIINFSETDDGRFMITLRGMCRFRVAEELAMENGFRRVRPDFDPFRTDFDNPTEEGIDRGQLLEAARGFLDVRGIECDWDAAKTASAQSLITTFAMICPFDPREKQALLECPSLADRNRLLISLFQMSALQADTAFSGTKH